MFKYGSVRLFLIKFVLGALLTVFGLVYLGSLFTYDLNDPGFNTFSSEEKQIDVKKHPTISFYSTHCTENAKRKPSASKEKEKTHNILFHGFLSMNGVQHGINIKSTITERTKEKNTKEEISDTHNYISELELSGIFHFNHSDFEINPYSNPFLLVNNDDLITVHYRLISSNE